MKLLLGLGVALIASLVALVSASAEPSSSGAPIYSFTVKDIDGSDVPLSKYKGDVLLVVNTASLCGNTPQYAALERLYQKYSGQGLRILAFPADNFAHQEPGNNGSIKAFCTSHYQVTFDLFSKISVKGDDQAPLYKYLTSKTTDPRFGGDIDWNFAKFLISRQGAIVNRFPAGHSPESFDVINALEKELDKPPTS